MTKHLLTAIAIVGSAASGSAFAQAVPDAKVAVVDTARLLTDCTACKAATAQLQAQQTQIRTAAQSLAAPLETEARALQTAVNALKGAQPDAALQARITAFQTKQQAAQQQVGTQEQTLQRNAAYVNQQIGTKARPIIQQIAQQRGATLAVDKGTTLFSAATIDITDAVMTQLNAQLPSVSVTAPAQAAAPAATRPTSPQGR